MRDEFDILVIGAGAAGLAAAQVLRHAAADFVVLEGRDRIGGRAHTVLVRDYPLDLGAGWLHSADQNPFAAVAERLGLGLDKTPPAWTRQAFDEGFGPAEQAEFARALDALETRIEAAANKGEEGPVAALLEPDGPWNPLLNAFSAYYNGAEFDEISIFDYAAYEDTDVNWRTPGGYGALIAAWGAEAPVALETPVTAVDHTAERLRVETPKGPLAARALVVTVPTPLIASGAIRFTPDLDELREAAEALPLGLADKVFLETDAPEAFPAESHLFGDPRRTETGSYHLRPFGRPILEVYLGGRHARALEAEGPGAAAAFAVDELASLLGSSVRARLVPLAASAWARDPWARGAYSHARPGGVWARAALARPIDGRIFIAGEATSASAFSTVHGAALSGAAAARAALAALAA